MWIILIVNFLSFFIFTVNSFSEDIIDRKNSDFLTVKKWYCGVPITMDDIKRTRAIEDSIKKYNENLRDKRAKVGKIADTPPDWTDEAGPVEEQDTNACWCHSATGVLVGMLHIYADSIYGINLNEDYIQDNWKTHEDGSGWPGTAFDNISLYKAFCELEASFPNNYKYAKYDLASKSLISGYESVISALNDGPVTTCVHTYPDYWGWFTDPDTKTKVYWWDGYTPSDPDSIGGHAMVIVSYDYASGATGDPDSLYWVLKDSNGTYTGDNGYLKFGSI
jgi:hypothetical protein